MQWWFLRKGGEPIEHSLAQDRRGRLLERSPYSPQYETIVAQGHERPTPSCGAPALIWHLAIWPRRQTDLGEDCDPNDTSLARNSRVAKQIFKNRRRKWLDEINRLLEHVQRKSSPRPDQPPTPLKTFAPIYPHELRATAKTARRGYVTPVQILERDTLTFTLWWADTTDPDPAHSAIRVRVHAELNADYASFSFYMDIGQPWNAAHSPQHMLGTRRSKLLRAVREVADICAHQFVPTSDGKPAPVDLPAVPEVLHCPDGRSEDELGEALRQARNLLYVDAWEEFCQAFECGLDQIAGTRGEVFANFRGLIISTSGMPSAGYSHAPEPADMASLGTVPFPNFSANDCFNVDGAEPNAVVKAFWPFVRRITPRSDFREFVACGVLNWRAIYITALGSSSQYVKGEERAASDLGTGEALIRVAPHLLLAEERSQAQPSPEGRFDSLVRARERENRGNNHPVRYLLLTKHPPHPRQIGRIAERINTMGTMRLFALKDWAAVRNADSYIRILGQDLDKITESWSEDKNLINTLKMPADVRAARADITMIRRLRARPPSMRWIVLQLLRLVPLLTLGRRKGPRLSGRWTSQKLQRLAQILPSYVPRNPANRAYKLVQWFRFHIFLRRSEYFAFVKQLDEDLAGDVRHSALYHISNEIETRLLQISSRLDELGRLTIGGLHFRLGRSKYYVREFEILLGTLQVANIPTWVSYEQFVRRGLAPAFDYMSSVGERLRAVRERLLSVTEMIETSALVGQAAATRHNTAVLRQTTTLAIVLLTLYLARTVIWNTLALALRPIYRAAPPSWRDLIDQFLLIFQ